MASKSKKNQEVDLATFMDRDDYHLLASDEVQNPLDEHECWYIWEMMKKYTRGYPCSSYEIGKWLFFVKNQYLHQMWRKACFLYRDGKLDGIKLLKVSTAKDNPRSSDDDRGVIIFYCGPCSNQKLMVRYGMNLVRLFRFTSDRGSIPYKSDALTFFGTVATGNKVNSVYTLPVPRSWREYENPHEPAYWREFTRGYRASESSNWRARDDTQERSAGKKASGEQINPASTVVPLPGGDGLELPSQTMDLLWLSEPKDYQYFKDGLPVEVGRWQMYIPRSNIDEAWLKACRAFRKREILSEVQSVRVTTRLSSYGRKVSILNFFCEFSEKEQLEFIGTSLVEIMDYKNEKGVFSYIYPDSIYLSLKVPTH